MTVEWLGYVASGFVGLAGGLGATWLGLLGARSAQREERQQERRADLYVEVLEEIARVWIPVLESGAQLVADELPRSLSIDEWFTLQARIDAFASLNVSKTYGEVRRRARSAVYWQEMVVQKNSVGLPWMRATPYTFPSDAKDLSRDETVAKMEAEREAFEKTSRSIRAVIRQELLTDKLSLSLRDRFALALQVLRTGVPS